MTTIAIAPGVVDTDMQKELRDIHASKMKEQDAMRFIKHHEEGTLLKPEQPGNVMARVVLAGPKELSGKYLRYCRSQALCLTVADFSIGGTVRSLHHFKTYRVRYYDSSMFES